MFRNTPRIFGGTAATLLAMALTARAQLAVTSNDNKFILVNGVNQVVPNPPPDTASIIDMSMFPPKLVAEISNVPGSVIGPPLSVAVTPDESLALVTAPMKVDPKDPTKQAMDNRLTMIDLKAQPPQVIATLETGLEPSGLSINHHGTLVLVANRGDGTISLFGIQGKTVSPLGKMVIGTNTSLIGDVAFTPDDKRAIVTRDGDNLVTFLNVDGTNVTLAGRDVRTGLRPYGVDVTRDGRAAVVANVGYGSGDNDTISVIDLQAVPPRVVDTLSVGQTPEGIKLSPDGTLCAVVVSNGSIKPKDSPFFSDHGELVLFRVDGTKLTPAGQVAIGHWPQGVVFSNDNRTLLVCNMVEKNLQVLQWDGTTLKDSGYVIPLSGGPAAIRTAE
ncbi:MAG: YncE family protein [Opitutales bacterium]|jgi:DNA-binding beta-propeller fold protein YncE